MHLKLSSPRGAEVLTSADWCCRNAQLRQVLWGHAMQTLAMLENCVEAIASWMSANRLKLNTEKTEIICNSVGVGFYCRNRFSVSDFQKYRDISSIYGIFSNLHYSHVPYTGFRIAKSRNHNLVISICDSICSIIIIISLYWNQVDNRNLLQWHTKQAATHDNWQHCTV